MEYASNRIPAAFLRSNAYGYWSAFAQCNRSVPYTAFAGAYLNVAYRPSTQGLYSEMKIAVKWDKSLRQYQWMNFDPNEVNWKTKLIRNIAAAANLKESDIKVVAETTGQDISDMTFMQMMLVTHFYVDRADGKPIIGSVQTIIPELTIPIKIRIVNRWQEEVIAETVKRVIGENLGKQQSQIKQIVMQPDFVERQVRQALIDPATAGRVLREFAPEPNDERALALIQNYSYTIGNNQTMEPLIRVMINATREQLKSDMTISQRATLKMFKGAKPTAEAELAKQAAAKNEWAVKATAVIQRAVSSAAIKFRSQPTDMVEYVKALLRQPATAMSVNSRVPIKAAPFVVSDHPAVMDSGVGPDESSDNDSDDSGSESEEVDKGKEDVSDGEMPELSANTPAARTDKSDMPQLEDTKDMPPLEEMQDMAISSAAHSSTPVTDMNVAVSSTGLSNPDLIEFDTSEGDYDEMPELSVAAAPTSSESVYIGMPVAGWAKHKHAKHCYSVGDHVKKSKLKKKSSKTEVGKIHEPLVPESMQTDPPVPATWKVSNHSAVQRFSPTPPEPVPIKLELPVTTAALTPQKFVPSEADVLSVMAGRVNTDPHLMLMSQAMGAVKPYVFLPGTAKEYSSASEFRTNTYATYRSFAGTLDPLNPKAVNCLDGVKTRSIDGKKIEFNSQYGYYVVRE
jgi:hypothetical protein